MKPGRLVLETGEVFWGLIPDKPFYPCYGEVVFNTGMTGYVETLTDPSYIGQILVFTYPLIGNYGVSFNDQESDKIQVLGVVMSECVAFHSHYLADLSLRAWLEKEQIPFISRVDTRALTKRLRRRGVVLAAMTSEKDEAPLSMDNREVTLAQVERVSLKTPRFYGEGNKTIIVVDCGLKENIIRCLSQFPWRIKRVSFAYDYTQEPYDGVVISNGPGDPTLFDRTTAILKKALEKKQSPVFGICLGAQLMALAIGAKTYKLLFGHRSQNQPYLYLPSGRCYLTSSNHGYTIKEESLPKGWHVLFRNLNDSTVGGITHETWPFWAVQFHPEASPGPRDTQWLFEQFYRQVSNENKERP